MSLFDIIKIKSFEIPAINDLSCGVSVSGSPIDNKNIKFITQYSEFSDCLMKNCTSISQNVVISPLSVLTILSIMANITSEDMKEKIRQAICKNSTISEFNQSFREVLDALQIEEQKELLFSNALFLGDENNIHIKNFNIIQEYYKIEFFKEIVKTDLPKVVNGWVKERTNGMIQELLSYDADMDCCLCNAITFEAKWENIPREVRKEIFTNAKGEKKEVQMLHSLEEFYVEDTRFKGFVKKYEGNRHAFMGVLPLEYHQDTLGINSKTVSEMPSLAGHEYHQNSLSGMEICDFCTLYRNRIYTEVDVEIPEFEFDFERLLNDIYDFLGQQENPKIDAIHKTYIKVDQQGVKAAGASAVRYETVGINSQRKKVQLNRPFLFAIMDIKEEIPIFIGQVNQL